MSSQGTASVTVSSSRKGLALAVIAIAQLMVVLDVSIVNVALASIQRALNFSPAGLEWVVNAYALAFGGLLLLGGRVADVYGKRRTLIAGLVLLVVASAAGGLAPGPGWLIGARVAQGVAGALIAPSALALIAVTFAPGAERNRAMGIYAAMSGAGGALGNVLGGALTTGLSWRWVLFVHIPIGLAALALAPRAFRRSDATGGRIDLLGAITATAGVSLIVYGLMHASSDSWSSAATFGPLVGGAALLAMFVLAESRQREPLMPLYIWRDRNRAGAYAVMLVVGATILAVFYFLTLFMQLVLGFSALRTGFGFLAFAVGAAVTSGISGQLVSRVGPRPLIGAGALALAAGLYWLSFIGVGAHYFTDLAGPLVLTGLGAGLCFVPLTLAAVVGVGEDAAGIPAALLNTCQQVGGGLGLAVFGTLAATTTRHRLDRVAPGSSSRLLSGTAGSMPLELRRLAGDALAHGYGIAYLVASATIAVAAVLAMLSIREAADPETAVPSARSTQHARRLRMDRPDVTMMILVHDAFRRDLDRMRSAATEPGALRATWLTFSRYLTIHHTAEDEILWPAIQAGLGEPAALFTEMADEHALLDPLMQEIDERLAHSVPDELPTYLDKLAALLAAHLEHEESAALPLIQDTLTLQQWTAFGDDQRRRVGIRGAARFFPWLLDGATPEQVDWALRLLPPPIRLVHHAIWKPRYERRMRAITPVRR